MGLGIGTVARSARAMPRNAQLLLLSLVLGALPIGLLMVLFPLYLHDLGMHSFLIGGIFTLAGIGSSLLLIVIGPLADRFGRRSYLIAGTALPALGFIIFAVSTDPRWLVLASLLGGVGFSGGLGGALVTATLNPMLSATVEPCLRTTVLAWNEGAWAFAMAVGSLLAGLPALLAHAGIAPALAVDHALFLFCFAVTIAATALLLPVREQPEEALPDVPQAPAGASWDARSSLPTILKLAVFFALQGAGLGLVVQLLPLLFALQYHTTAAAIAPWFAVAQIAGLFTIPLVPSLARRLGTARVILLVAATSTLMLVGVPLSPTLPMAGAFYVLRSAFIAMQWPAQQSFLQGAVPPRIRGTATSVTLGCWSLANAFLPSLAGYLLDRHLTLWPLVLGVICYSAAALWFGLTLRHTPLPEETGGQATAPAVADAADASIAR